MTPVEPFAAACQREDEWGLIAAAMACEQPSRLVPVLQLVHEDSIQDRAVRAVWAAIRSWWRQHRRLPGPDELYRAVSMDHDVERAGGWPWLQRVLSAQPNSGALEDIAWAIVARSRCYAVSMLLLQAAKKIGRVRPEQAPLLLDRIAAEARDAAAAIRQLARHNASWRDNMIRYTEGLLHGRARGRA